MTTVEYKLKTAQKPAYRVDQRAMRTFPNETWCS